LLPNSVVEVYESFFIFSMTSQQPLVAQWLSIVLPARQMTTNPLCAYRDALGRPGMGVHAPRILGLAMNDVVMTLAAGIVLGWLSGFGVLLTTAILFALGVALHRLFCVRTAVDRMIFG
jgi:hypothetical protein